jgi:hypothetical protein
VTDLLGVLGYVVAGYLVMLLAHYTASFDPYEPGDWYFCWMLWPIVLVGCLIVYLTRLCRLVRTALTAS